MTEDHPITPPQWLLNAWRKLALAIGVDTDAVLLDAVRWGADEELEACLEWMKIHLHSGSSLIKQLRAARRPKPPSLSEPALEALDRMDQFPTAENQYIIRRALERLQELEGNG